MEKISLISLIVPAYKQQKTIYKNIKTLKESLVNIGIPFEIIVVVDGKVDRTFENAKKVTSSSVRILGYKENKGKGFAVKYGVEKARGDIIGFIDAGLDIDPTGIAMLLNHMVWYDADIIVGSKLHPVSQVHFPLYRKILSWGYRKFTHLLFGFKIRDTQVGLKLFKRKVSKDVFSRSLIKDFAFDVEVLALAYALGYKKIYEAPIKLKFQRNSSITSANFWKIVSRMTLDTLAIFYRLKIRQYYKKSNRNNWIVR